MVSFQAFMVSHRKADLVTLLSHAIIHFYWGLYGPGVAHQTTGYWKCFSVEIPMGAEQSGDGVATDRFSKVF